MGKRTYYITENMLGFWTEKDGKQLYIGPYWNTRSFWKGDLTGTHPKYTYIKVGSIKARKRANISPGVRIDYSKAYKEAV